MLRRQRLLTENRPREDSKLGGRRNFNSERLGTEPIASTDQQAQAFRIQVCIRVRPLNQRQNGERSITVESESSLRMDWTDKKPRQYSFSFDRVFDETATNRTIYTEVGNPLISGLLQGYNASVFAYGATGSGKTYTMFGSDQQPGVVSLSIRDLFKELEPKMDLSDMLVKLTCVELYNENLYDLLSDQLTPVELRESPSRGVFLAGASEVIITSEKEASRLLRKVSGRRQTQATFQNESSSRSHAIIQISVEQKERCQGLQQEMSFSKLSLIDLAGSEKSGTSLNSYESKKINQSLLVLGNCIHELSKNSERGSRNHVPFRDSKLTRLLKDSLGGNTRTVMISTVSPSVSSYDEGYNTLVYSSYTNKIEVKLKKNHRRVDRTHVADYARIIAELRGENDRIRAQLGSDYSSNRSESEKYDLEKGFQGEVLVRQKLLQVEEKLQNMEFDQFRTLYATSKGEKVFRAIDPVEIEKLQQQRNLLTDEYNQIRLKRKELVDRIRPTQRSEVIEYIGNKVLQFEISQLQNEKIQKSKKTTELQTQRIQVNLLLDQLKHREKIISQQNHILGKEETPKQYQSVKEEPPTPQTKKDEQWFYAFLESLETKDTTNLLPTINRLKSQSHHTKPLQNNRSNDQPASESKLPPFRKADQRPTGSYHRRLRSRSIKQKSVTKQPELEQLSRNEYSEFLERNISRYQSYKSKKL